jgi:hypothetical protein
MEVGEQGADDAKLEAGKDEDVSCCGVRFDGAFSSGQRGGFEGADNCCADGDDAAVLRDSAIDGFGGCGADGIALAVEMDLVNELDAERSECAEANVERDARYLDSFG